MIRNLDERFKKFGGEQIPSIVEYLKNVIAEQPTITISVGCDSIQRRRKTMYAMTIMMYNTDIRNGAHVVFFRENLAKVRDNFERLQKESEYAHEIAEFLDRELSDTYKRADLTDIEKKRYKYHLLKSAGHYPHIQLSNEEGFIRNLILSDAEKFTTYKLVDIHLDYNPFEGSVDKKGVAKNRSNASYKIYAPWLRTLGYRVFCKPIAYSSTSAADLLLQD